eukprot:scaffold214776_cov19-Tisochrysis_lutea.AAC.1
MQISKDTACSVLFKLHNFKALCILQGNRALCKGAAGSSGLVRTGYAYAHTARKHHHLNSPPPLLPFTHKCTADLSASAQAPVIDPAALPHTHSLGSLYAST